MRYRKYDSSLTLQTNMPTAPADRTATTALIAVLGVVLVLAVTTIVPEISYYDEGVYLVTAKAMAAGEGYRNANLPGEPPQGLYPPVVPALLAIGWHIWPVFPQNIHPMKLAMALFGLATLIATYLYLTASAAIGRRYAVAAIAMTGLQPMFLRFATQLTSEIPYMFFSMAALLGYARFTSSRDARWLGPTIAGLVLAMLTRSIGVALLIAMIVDALVRRQVKLAAVLTGIGACVLLPWTAWSWHARAAYLAYPPEVAANYRGYVVNLVSAGWLAGLHRALLLNALGFVSNWVSWIAPWASTAGVFVIVLTMLPVAKRLGRKPRVHDWYCAAAAVLILLWPWPINDRFVLVIGPFLVAYAIEGLEALAIRASAGQRLTAALVSALAVGAIAYDARDIAATFRIGALREPIYEQFHETTAWLKTHTAPEEAIVAADDTSYYLWTGRHTIRLAYPDPFIVYYRPSDPAFAQPLRALAWFKYVGACYIVRDPLIGGAQETYYDGLIESLRRADTGVLIPVFRSPDKRTQVFKLQSCG